MKVLKMRRSIFRGNKTWLWVLGLIGLGLISESADGQQAVQEIPLNGTGSISAVTAGVTDVVIYTPPTTGGLVRYLDILNASNSATVCINFGATATIAGTQCAAGEYVLPPNWHKSWPEGGATFVPTDAIHAIASAATTQVTLTVK